MTETKITREDLIALMEEIHPVPQKFRTLPEDVFIANLAMNMEALKQVLEHDLEQIAEFLEEINQHLTEVDHTFDSPCWGRRAEALSAQALLKQKYEELERLAFALRQYADPDATIN